MARYKDDHWDQTHESIVVAAARLIRARGFSATGIAEVMKAVGLTHGGFYAHFDDKTAMLVEATERAFAQNPKNFVALARMAADAGDPGVVAEGYLRDAQVADVEGGCPGAALMSDVPRQPEAVRKAFDDGSQATARALGEAVGLSTKGQPEAWAALGLLMGSLSLMRATGDAKTRNEIRRQAVEALRTLSRAAPRPSRSRR